MIKNYGDITQIDGTKLPPVNIISAGSPCQNFSKSNAVNKNMLGLEGSDSKLFFDLIRVIKEMYATNKKPDFVIFENVPSVLYINGGKDFVTIIEAFASVREPNYSLTPNDLPTWSESGYVQSEKNLWSIAWRVCDSLLWGIPQRRKRLMMLVSYCEHSPKETLFKGFGQTTKDRMFQGKETDMFGNKMWVQNCGAYNTSNAPDTPVTPKIETIIEHKVEKKHHMTKRQATTMLRLASENNIAIQPVLEKIFHAICNGDDTIILGSHEWDVENNNVFCAYKSKKDCKWVIVPFCNTVRCGLTIDGTKVSLLVVLKTIEKQKWFSICSFEIRRFSPLEVERLFGYNDNWTKLDTNGKTIADTHRYRLLGNTIVLPQWKWLLKTLRNATGAFGGASGTLTLGSAFDGICGFPVCANEAGIETLWVSEIDKAANEVFDVNFNNALKVN